MANMVIGRPLPGTITFSWVNGANLLTPDPKEVAYAGATGFQEFTIDLGSEKPVGAVYFGGVSKDIELSYYVQNTVGTSLATGTINAANKRTAAAPFQYFASFAPVNARRLIVYSNPTAGDEIGVAAMLETFQPTWNQEWGAGRFLIDTGTATRNRAGGFGIEQGAIVPGYEFTLGDLTDTELEVLYDMLRKVGETSPIIIAEEPTNNTDLDARVHYGLFQRLEKYERQQLGVTRWSLKMEEWR